MAISDSFVSRSRRCPDSLSSSHTGRVIGRVGWTGVTKMTSPEEAVALVDELGETVEARVRRSQRSEPSANGQEAEAADDEALRALVARWALEQGDLTIVAVTVDGGWPRSIWPARSARKRRGAR
ncbi:MAG: hypothetical protein ACE5EV_00340 [Gaiellales bacterium]